jgi:hypothetical protein
MNQKRLPNLFRFVLLSGMLLFFTFSLNGQSEDKDYNFKDHLWYGINIGNIGIGGNALSLGFAPMGGYRINDFFSVGLITKLNYTYAWQRLGDNFHFLDYGIGALGRAKLFNQKYFLQVEYDWMSMTDYNGLGQVRDTYPFFYVGGGIHYPGNDKWSSELSILYNLHPDSNQFFFPLTMSYAFVYNF